MPEVGERYLGTVVKTTNFGAFISLLPRKDGLLHISKLRGLAGGKRVEERRGRGVGRPEDPGRDRRDRRPRKLSLIPVLEMPTLSRTRPTTGDATHHSSEARHHPHPAVRQGRGHRRTTHGAPRRAAGGDRGPAGRALGGRRGLAGRGVARRDARLSGASHFLEHLLFKGTPTRSALDISVALDEVGGEFNAFTATEYTCYHARVLDEDLPLAIDVLGDMLTSSTISGADGRGRSAR